MFGKIVLIQGTFDYRDLFEVGRFESEYIVQKRSTWMM